MSTDTCPICHEPLTGHVSRPAATIVTDDQGSSDITRTAGYEFTVCPSGHELRRYPGEPWEPYE